jgi:putative transposase
MPRVPRTSLPDGYFHVSARGIPAAGNLFRDDDDRRAFVALVWIAARRHAWTCHALCVLSTHYHLVLEVTRERLSTGLRDLNWRYARHVNSRHGLFGHVFAGRYSARAIASEEYLYDACAYVVLNPVRAGLCDRAEEWPWSYSSYDLVAA